MESSNKGGFWLLFAIKLSIATIIFYIGFSYNLKQTGHQTSNIGDIDYVTTMPTTEIGFDTDTGRDAETSIFLEGLLSPTHDASDIVPQDIYMQSFQNICRQHSQLCASVRFVGDFSSYEQLMYMVGIVRIVSQTDRLLSIGGFASLTDALQQVTINKMGGTRRGGATRNTLVINLANITTYTEFFEVFTHEIGHIVDLGVLGGVSRNQDQNFTEFGKVVFAADDASLGYYKLSWKNETTRTLLSTSDDFCSGYAMTNPFEDFAECFNLYMNHNAYFASIAQDNTALQQKYNFLANILNGAYLFAAGTDVTRAQDRRIGWRPWDSTRMWQ